MKIDKLNLDGKKDSIEVLDKIFSAKINKQLVSNVLYKTNANYKGEKLKQNKRMKLLDLQQRYIPKKALEMRDMLVKKHLYLLEVVLHMVQKEKATIRLEN